MNCNNREEPGFLFTGISYDQAITYEKPQKYDNP